MNKKECQLTQISINETQLGLQFGQAHARHINHCDVSIHRETCFRLEVEYSGPRLGSVQKRGRVILKVYFICLASCYWSQIWLTIKVHSLGMKCSAVN